MTRSAFVNSAAARGFRIARAAFARPFYRLNPTVS